MTEKYSAAMCSSVTAVILNRCNIINATQGNKQTNNAAGVLIKCDANDRQGLRISLPPFPNFWMTHPVTTGVCVVFQVSSHLNSQFKNDWRNYGGTLRQRETKRKQTKS